INCPIMVEPLKRQFGEGAIVPGGRCAGSLCRGNIQRIQLRSRSCGSGHWTAFRSVGAMAYTIACKNDGTTFVAIWYTVGCVIMAGVGVVFWGAWPRLVGWC